MRRLFLSVFVAAFALTSVAAPKSIKFYSDCIGTLDNLMAVTSSVTSLTGKEQGGLIKLASDAKNLYLIGKTNDSLKKLYDFQIKLEQLASTLETPKPKISGSDAQTLKVALNEAIACVSGA